MCGFAGVIWKKGASAEGREKTVQRMVNTLKHRGPNSEGWIRSDFADVAFRRLSIIDLQHGHQPACNEDKTVQVFLNGEIYNHVELRQTLASAGHVFNSNSDTEVLPHLYEEHGIKFLSRLNGMFAICIVDHTRGRVFLCRDRLGIKPLFYASFGDGLAFASELKAILASGRIAREVNMAAALDFIDYFSCPEPHTLIKGVNKLEPGGILQGGREIQAETSRFYRVPVLPENESCEPNDEALDTLMSDAVRLRLVADVPVGISLSGGIDSSLIATYAKDVDISGLTAFTVDFPSTPREELNSATLLARKLGLKHIVLSAAIDDFNKQAVRAIWFSDEPIADPAYFAATKVAEVASDHVTVMLAGTGGDELFAGYGRYILNRRNRILQLLPKSIASNETWRRLLSLPNEPDTVSALASYPQSRLEWHTKTMSNLNPADRAELAAALSISSVRGAAFAAAFAEVPNADNLNQQLYCDTVTYLRSQLLPLLDRTTMSVSIEGRVPFLDYRVVEAAFRIAGSHKLGSGRDSKAILKRIARKRGVPETVLSRKKLGFPNPVLEWFGGPLGEMLPRILLAPGTFSGDTLRSWVAPRVATKESIAQNWRALYALLVLNIWHQLFVRTETATPPDISLDELFDRDAGVVPHS